MATEKNRPVLNEAVWRRAERAQVIRERFRLMSKGVINVRTKPQMLIKNSEGAWVPEIKVFG